jgi:glyoxylase-like metal-dependent hydrolase (beta-lactamase superfamily II)
MRKHPLKSGLANCWPVKGTNETAYNPSFHRTAKAAGDAYRYMKDRMNDFYIISFSSTNYYLLKCNDGFLLIDAGWAGKYKKFKRELSRLGIGMDSIRYILLTHHHHDHAALIQNIRNETNCRIIVHIDETGYIEKGITYTDETNQFNTWLKLLDRLASPFIQYNYNPIALKEDDIIITDGDYDICSLTGVRGRIIHTPGHSKGSISLLLENGNSFVGDVAMNILKVFGSSIDPLKQRTTATYVRAGVS